MANNQDIRRPNPTNSGNPNQPNPIRRPQPNTNMIGQRPNIQRQSPVQQRPVQQTPVQQRPVQQRQVQQAPVSIQKPQETVQNTVEVEESIDFGNTLEQVEEKASRKDKRGKDKKDANPNAPVETKKYVLYAIIDKQIDGLLNYFRNFGINVSKIFYNIKDARDALLMQIEPSKIIVIDTGTGRFANMAARKDLIDLMGISDEENHTTVFYSDSIIKTEVEYTKEVKDKQIEWVKYNSTAGVVAYLLQKMPGTEYVIDGGYSKAAEISKTLKLKGFKDNTWTNNSLGIVQINTSEINHMCDSDTAPYTLLNAYDLYI